MSKKSDGLQIKYTSDVTGIDAHTLRAWEKRYKILDPIRRGNRRIYHAKDILKLKQLKELVDLGHNIGKVADWSDEEREKRLLKNSNGDTDKKRRESLIYFLKKYDLKKVKELLKKEEKRNSAETFLSLFITPLLQEIGLLVESKSLNIAQEHALSSLVRIQILQMNTPKSSSHLPPLAFCTPEGDFHELGILIAQKLAESNKFQTISFGTNLPASSLIDITNACLPKIVIIGTTSIASNLKNFNQYIEEVEKKINPSTQLWIAGSMAETYKNKYITIKRMADFIQQLKIIKKQYNSRKINS